MRHTAIVTGIAPNERPDLSELCRLVEAVGGQVAETVSQRRDRVPGTVFGAGTVAEIAALVASADADTVVVDSVLSPAETITLEEETGARVIDRHRLVLEIFAEQARTKRAKHQVELARLKYELPRIEQTGDPDRLNIILETGTRYHDVLDRIDRLEKELAELPPVADEAISRRREAGFDLVAITGYTNAGKSTLLRQLADDMAIEEEEGTHPDLAVTAATEDRLFKTLETTTRRATIDGRRVLLTDTVGFLDDLPHWLVSSFRGTLEIAREADAVVLVMAADQPGDELRRKVETSLETLGEAAPPTVPVLNKTDVVDVETMMDRRSLVQSTVGTPVTISALTGEGIDAFERELLDTLPPLDQAELEIPLTDDGMSMVSWMHDNATAVDVDYGTDSVRVSVSAKPSVVETARDRLDELTR